MSNPIIPSIHYQDAIAEIGLHINQQEAKIARLNERFLEVNKNLYTVRSILEKEYEIINKEKVAIPIETRVCRAMEVLRKLTPSGPNNIID